MAKPLSELIKKLPNKVNAIAAVKTAEILAEMNLTEIRQAQQVTQTQVAEALSIKQPSVAQDRNGVRQERGQRQNGVRERGQVLTYPVK